MIKALDKFAIQSHQKSLEQNRRCKALTLSSERESNEGTKPSTKTAKTKMSSLK